MCTRFYVEPDTEEIREIIAEVQRSQLSGKFIKAGEHRLRDIRAPGR